MSWNGPHKDKGCHNLNVFIIGSLSLLPNAEWPSQEIVGKDVRHDVQSVPHCLYIVDTILVDIQVQNLAHLICIFSDIWFL